MHLAIKVIRGFLLSLEKEVQKIINEKVIDKMGGGIKISSVNFCNKDNS